MDSTASMATQREIVKVAPTTHDGLERLARSIDGLAQAILRR